MADTKIEWCDKSWNVVAGCTKCSPGCENCYAEKMAKRQVAMGCARGGDNTATWEAYSTAINPKTGKWSGKIALRHDQLDKPSHWKEPSRIFVCSMSDLFHPKVPFEFIAKVWDIMFECHQHVFLILTKRIKRVAEFCKWLDKEKYRVVAHFNIHLGVSISNQAEADEKIPILLQIPAAVRWLSVEPILEPIDLSRVDFSAWETTCLVNVLKGEIVEDSDIEMVGTKEEERISWVVVGGESGPKRRPCNTEWVQSIVDQCRAASVPVFVKQIHRDGKVVKMPEQFPQEYPERS